MSTSVKKETHFHFEAEGESIGATICHSKGSDPPSVLFLHGAGPLGQNCTSYIADALAERGLGSLRFAFPGHGESSGRNDEASLAQRCRIAFAATRHLNVTAPLTLIGTSMGGHVAAELTRSLPVGCLVLFCPAAYGASTVALKFGGGFTEAIRSPGSWRDSPAFESIKAYSGRLLHVIGAQDTIIPQQVTALYRESALRTSESEFVVIEDAPHPIHTWLAKHEVQRRKVVELVCNFIG